MGFFEFHDEFFEATAPGPTRPSSSNSAARPIRPVPGGRPANSATRSPAAGQAGSPTSRQRASGPPPPGRPATAGRQGSGAAAATTPNGQHRQSATPASAGRTTQTPPSGAARTQPPPTNAAAAQRTSGGGSSALDSLSSIVNRLPSYAGQAWDFTQNSPQAVQAAQQFAGALGLGQLRTAGTPPPAGDGGPPPAQSTTPGTQPPASTPSSSDLEPVGLQPAVPSGATAQQPGGGSDQIALLLQALGQRQIPPLPAAPALSGAPGSLPAAAPQQGDAFGLLRLILTNPQFQRALQSSSHSAAAVPRTVTIPVPSAAVPRHVRPVPIPLGAVLNAILALAGHSMAELNESTSDDDPEVPAYLVGDDGDFLVDPASDDDRAALVTHLFRLSEAAQRSGRGRQPSVAGRESDGELDESDGWARAAGLL